jgi:hypothetical protein
MFFFGLVACLCSVRVIWKALAISPDGRYLAVGCEDRKGNKSPWIKQVFPLLVPFFSLSSLGAGCEDL